MPRFVERKFLPYTQEQIFDLVADIENYPHFLPWCLGARITKRDGDVLYADLIIGWKLIREKFTSQVTLKRPDEIDVTYIEGPMKQMKNIWRFEKADGGTIIDFFVEFEFKSKTLQSIMGTFFNEVVRRMVTAFEVRAKALYG